MLVDDLVDVGCEAQAEVGQKDGPGHQASFAMLPSDPQCRWQQSDIDGEISDGEVDDAR